MDFPGIIEGTELSFTRNINYQYQESSPSVAWYFNCFVNITVFFLSVESW